MLRLAGSLFNYRGRIVELTLDRKKERERKRGTRS